MKIVKGALILTKDMRFENLDEFFFFFFLIKNMVIDAAIAASSNDHHNVSMCPCHLHMVPTSERGLIKLSKQGSYMT